MIEKSKRAHVISRKFLSKAAPLQKKSDKKDKELIRGVTKMKLKWESEDCH